MTATSPVDALRIAEQHQNRIDLLVTDVMMPEMNGFDLADRLKYAIPNLKILFMSGYVAAADQERGRSINFLGKPFSLQALCATVRSILEGNAGF
jgi:CheY-like chemotaxis protein